jgi:proteasome assembly chaperone (PAC2) family protein
MARRSRYEGPTGIASVLLEAARHRGMVSLTLMGQAPHYLQGTTNPAMRQALLTAVARLLDLELDVSPLDAAVQAFRTRCDQAVAQAYDVTGDETPHSRRDDAFNPEQLMHELEDFLRQERDRGAE